MRTPEEISILVVDDEPMLREVTAEHLRLSGFKVVEAPSGNEAKKIIGTMPLDIIISDVRMPDGDGEALLLFVKEKYPEKPVVLMVSGFTGMTRKKAIDLGALDLLKKQVSMGDVEKIILENVTPHTLARDITLQS